jgi:hypothetical protein
MYSICLSTGEAVRLSDNKVVAPCQSCEDTAFTDYIDWIMLGGNQPTELP